MMLDPFAMLDADEKYVLAQWGIAHAGDGYYQDIRNKDRADISREEQAYVNFIHDVGAVK